MFARSRLRLIVFREYEIISFISSQKTFISLRILPFFKRMRMNMNEIYAFIIFFLNWNRISWSNSLLDVAADDFSFLSSTVILKGVLIEKWCVFKLGFIDSDKVIGGKDS